MSAAIEPPQQKPKPKPIWPWLLVGAIVLGFIIVVLVIVFAPARYVWTDDAYITAHYTSIAPRISGPLTQVAVTDNQMVRQGQLLAAIDDRDYRTALAQAEAQLQSASAQVQNAKAQLDRQPSLILQAKAQLASANAQLAFAKVNAARYRSAAASGADTNQDRQQADSQLRQAQAAVEGDAASLNATILQTPILQAQLRAAQAVAASDAATVNQARLNLSYTRMTAPTDGMIGELSAQVGNYVGPGAAVMALVPLKEIYVVANYRELALKRMLPGQHVRIHVDAYDTVVYGVVDSIPPASGAAFEPIEPNNATGNFTKIVQRLPIKITFLPNQAALPALRVGMSVETSVDTSSLNNMAH
jgi:membrane fusion protein (multidrug efflux system)